MMTTNKHIKDNEETSGVSDKHPEVDKAEEILGVDDTKEGIPEVDDAEEIPGMDDNTPEDKSIPDKVEAEEKTHGMEGWRNKPAQTTKKQIQPQEPRQRPKHHRWNSKRWDHVHASQIRGRLRHLSCQGRGN